MCPYHMFAFETLVQWLKGKYIGDPLLRLSVLAAEQPPAPVAFTLPNDNMRRLLDPPKEPRVIQVSLRATNEADNGFVRLLINRSYSEFWRARLALLGPICEAEYMRNIIVQRKHRGNRSTIWSRWNLWLNLGRKSAALSS